MKPRARRRRGGAQSAMRSRAPWVLTVVMCACLAGAMRAGSGDGEVNTAPTLEDTRVLMGKWIETQQIISKERTDWQQGKEILTSRLELVKKEIGTLDEKIAAAKTAVDATETQKNELLLEKGKLDDQTAQLAAAVTEMEAQVRTLAKSLPDPVRTKLQPLYQRIPEDPATTKITVAERFQNVLGILNEVNKANNEIAVEYEVRELEAGKTSEVRVIYAGLGQAWYVSAGGDAGIGRPTADGWKWEPSKVIAGDVSLALEILQGKHSPAFVPLPVKIQ
jgi:hypothetical protein